MIKRIFTLILAAALISSCGNTGKKVGTASVEGSAKVEFASLAANPDNYVGKNIIVEGKVVHVCTESGKKLFIVGENPDVRLYIQAGENMPKFPMDLLGSNVVVEGTINKVAGGEMAMAEGDKKMESGKMAGCGMKMTGDTCETEKALAVQTTLADIVMDYKSHTLK